MKQIVFSLVLIALLFGCQNEPRTDYVINGKAEEVYNGIRIYLKKIDNRGKEVVKDTAIVMNERFTMTGKVDEPSIHFLAVDGLAGNTIFMLENSEIDIKINKENLMQSEVSGSETNESFQKFQNQLNAIRSSSQDVMTAYRQLKLPEEQAKKDSLTAELERLGMQIQNHPLDFVQKNPDSYFSLNLIGLEANKPKIDVPGFKTAYDNLSEKLKSTPKGKEVGQRIDALYEEYQRVAHLDVGNLAPNFQAPQPDGTMLSLDDVKGKVTVIDFWAAWCGPCRRENPNVVRIYNQYHDQGLEIIGVSLDGQKRQQNPKQAWLDAIAKDQLTWNHVSNLKYFNDPVAKLYNITAIPATYILDEQGKIVAKNLRGKALENKIRELLEN